MRRILIIGDSLTYGFDPRGAFGGRYPETIRWTDRLAHALEGEWEILTDAANGREIPASGAEVSDVKNTILSSLPLDIIAVLIGTNDYLNMYEPDIVEVTKRMKKFLEEILAMPEIKESAAQLMLLAPPYIHTKQDDFYAKYDTTNGLFNKAYKALAEHLGILFFDTGAWKAECSFDNIHLSEQGNVDFAERMEETLVYLSVKFNSATPDLDGIKN